jgi:hypothetical protein
MTGKCSEEDYFNVTDLQAGQMLHLDVLVCIVNYKNRKGIQPVSLRM